MQASSTAKLWPTLAGAVGGACVTFALMHLDAFDAFYDFTRAHESWQLDELIIAAIIGAIFGLGALAICLQRDLARLRTAYSRLLVLQAALQEQLPLEAGTDRTTLGAAGPADIPTKLQAPGF